MSFKSVEFKLRILKGDLNALSQLQINSEDRQNVEGRIKKIILQIKNNIQEIFLIKVIKKRNKLTSNTNNEMGLMIEAYDCTSLTLNEYEFIIKYDYLNVILSYRLSSDEITQNHIIRLVQLLKDRLKIDPKSQILKKIIGYLERVLALNLTYYRDPFDLTLEQLFERNEKAQGKKYVLKDQKNLPVLNKKKSSYTSSYVGVSWHKASCSWNAQINFRNKHYHIGYFKDELIAAKNYDNWVRKFKKKSVNFPNKEEGEIKAFKLPH